MERADALRKVVALLAKAESTSEHEAYEARSVAFKLRLKFGISDAEIAAELDPEPEIEFFGVRFGFYGKRISPMIKEFRERIETATKLLDGHLDEINRLHNDMKALNEIVVKARDKTIKEAYKKEIAEYVERGYREDDPHAHAMAVSRIKGDLRKDTVERIVGVSENALWQKQAKEWQDEEDRKNLARSDQDEADRQDEEAG